MREGKLNSEDFHKTKLCKMRECRNVQIKIATLSL